MSGLFIFDKAYEMLGKSMDISARRHSLITGNIANMDTIGYRPRDIDFHSALERAMAPEKDSLDRTNPKHMKSREDNSPLKAEFRKSAGNKYSPDSVNIDTEMTNLVENNIKYRTSVEMLLRKISILRESITDGGK